MTDMDWIGQIKGLVDVFIDGDPDRLQGAMIPVEVFRGHEDFFSPTDLGEEAQQVAASREYVAEILSEGHRILSVCDTILVSCEEEYGDALDVRLAERASFLIASGYAMDERRADAKTYLIQDRIQVRAVKMQRERLATFVTILEEIHREWRATEFTLDRLVRITNLRLLVSEV